MVQPSARVYSLAYVNTAQFERLRPNLGQLGTAHNTEISFDFFDQCFEIRGKSQQACGKTAVIICKNLMPLLFRQIQPDYINGVFCDYKQQIYDKPNLSGHDEPLEKQGEGEYYDEDNKSESTISSEPISDDNSDYYDDDSDNDLPRASFGTKTSKKLKDTKTAKSSPATNRKMHGTFNFAKNVKDPEDILYGPPQGIMGVAEYLVIVGEDTNTECSLDGRTINIHGTDKRAIDTAIQRFISLQSVYKRRRRNPNVVPCVHSFDQQGEIGLFFCNIDLYANQYFIAIPRHLQKKKWTVMISTTKNDSGRYVKPKDLLEPGQMPSTVLDDDLERRFQAAAKISGRSPQIQPPRWEQNANATFNTTSTTFSRSSNLPPPTWVTPPQQPAAGDFPELSSPLSRPRGSPSPRGGGLRGGRRVMRLTPQKAAKPAARSNDPPFIANYNLHNMKEALVEGLSSINHYRGEICLVAKLGKVLWSAPPKDVEKEVWGFYDIKDICMKEHKMECILNDTTTMHDDVNRRLAAQLPAPFAKSSFFEVHVDARPTTRDPWGTGCMYIESAGAKTTKLHMRQDVITEINWMNVDRKFDFQLSLAVKDVGRPDNKPFISFARRIALRPSDNPAFNNLMFQNIHGVLTVKKILHKQTERYRLNQSFVLEVAKVEQVPIQDDAFSTANDRKFSTNRGAGPTHYEYTIQCLDVDKIFAENVDKLIGVPASWNADQVVSQHLENFIRFMMDAVSRFDKSC